MRLSNVKLGIWKFYDDDGNLIKTIDEEEKFKDVPFTYNNVILWLERKGYVELETAKGKDKITIYFNSVDKVWTVVVVDHNIQLHKEFEIDKNGKIIRETDVNSVK